MYKLLETIEGTLKLRAGGLGGGDFNYKVRARAVRIGTITFDGPLINLATGRGAAGRRDGISLSVKRGSKTLEITLKTFPIS